MTLPRLDAAVVVPGFLSGASDFREMADSLSARGIRTAVVPMAAWHWLPCLGGRSMRPILERIDHTVRHLAAAEGDPAAVPGFEYSWQDCLTDFVHTPGGIWEVGGSAEVQEYPIVEPRGHFPEAGAARGRVALIGHSAGGWISRVYLSKRRASMALVPPSSALPPRWRRCSARRYGGRAYDGSQLVHSLVTLGAPLADSSGRPPAPAAARGVGATRSHGCHTPA